MPAVRLALMDQSRMLLAASNSAADPIGGGFLSDVVEWFKALAGAPAWMQDYVRNRAHIAIFAQRSGDSSLDFCIGDMPFMHLLHVLNVNVHKTRDPAGDPERSRQSALTNQHHYM
jgi:hypothetical protein